MNGCIERWIEEKERQEEPLWRWMDGRMWRAIFRSKDCRDRQTRRQAGRLRGKKAFAWNKYITHHHKSRSAWMHARGGRLASFGKRVDFWPSKILPKSVALLFYLCLVIEVHGCGSLQQTETNFSHARRMIFDSDRCYHEDQGLSRRTLRIEYSIDSWSLVRPSLIFLFWLVHPFFHVETRRLE